MAHFTRLKPDTGWPNGYVPTGADFDALDGKTVKAINGDEGGAWAPAASLAIGGQGIRMVGATFGFTAASVVQPAAGKKLRFGNADYPRFVPNQARTIMLSLGDGVLQSQQGEWQVDTFDFGAKAQANGVKLRCILRVHDNAVLYLVRFHFRIRGTHSILPAQLPKFRVIRVAYDGTPTPLKVDSETDSDGWYTMPTPANTTAYENGAASQYVQYTSFSTTIDASKYRYYAEVQEEAGAGAWTTGGTGNAFTHCTLGFSNIPDARPQ